MEGSAIDMIRSMNETIEKLQRELGELMFVDSANAFVGISLQKSGEYININDGRNIITLATKDLKEFKDMINKAYEILT